MDKERLNFVYNTIHKGMEEYRFIFLVKIVIETRETPVFEEVCQGFLIPVMLGWFDEKKERTNYEEPTNKWIEDITSSGFLLKKQKNLFPYWWAGFPLLVLQLRILRCSFA